MDEQTLQKPLDPPEMDPSEDLTEGEKTSESGHEQEEQPGCPATEEPAGLDPEPAKDDLSSTEEKVPLETPAETDDQSDRTLSPVPPADLPDPQELGRLREELNRLRQEIRSARKSLIEQETELEEFRDLFPDVSLSSLPDSVLNDVQRGVPLAAAYALMERRNAHLRQIAKATNAANDQRSSGSAEGNSTGFLSAAEVRAMTPEQVRKQYRQILLSMPKWH